MGEHANLDGRLQLCKTLVFSDEVTFNLCGKVNKHNVRIWGFENTHDFMTKCAILQNVMCFVSVRPTLFLCGANDKWIDLFGHGDVMASITVTTRIPKLYSTTVRQTSTLPLGFRAELNNQLPERWIRRAGPNHKFLLN